MMRPNDLLIDSFYAPTFLGPLTSDACTARFARTLVTGYSAGLPIIDALDYAAAATGNWVFTHATGADQIVY